MVRTLLAGTGVLASAGTFAAARGVRTALGGRPDPEAMRRSPRYRDGAFHNAEPPRWLPPGSGKESVRDFFLGGARRHPSGAVPLVSTARAAEGGGPYLTWYGHASTLVELGGARALLDPVWSERVSPSRLLGPRRLHPTPCGLADLPRLDVVVISHDHYDHLDMATVRTLVRTQDAPFVVPLGVGAHLRAWAVPEDRIVELDWHEDVVIAGLRVTATPARHFSGRGFARNGTLWASWALAAGEQRVFYSGDTGYTAAFAETGERYGPFDATLIQLGAYAKGWPDIHMTPEEAVATHLDVGGRVLVPVHWGTFNLAPHGWAEPVDRAWKEAKARDVTLVVPRPGERVDVTQPPPVDGWWQTLA